MNRRAWVLSLFLLVSCAGSAVYAQSGDQAAPEVEPGQPRKGWAFKEAGKIPMQSGGRVKPLDSYAREMVLFETGSRTFQGWDPVDLLFSWVTSPREWETRQFIQVSRQDVKRQLGLDENRSRFSPKELFQESFLAQYAEGLSSPGGANQSAPISAVSKPDPRDQELRRLVERIHTYRGIISGDGWPVVPSLKAEEPWAPLTSTDFRGKAIRAQYATLLTAYLAKNEELFDHAVAATRATVESEIKDFSEHTQRVLDAEVFYNRTHPFMVAWILYLAASLVWVAARFVQGPGIRRFKSVGLVLTGGAAVFHIGGIALRCYIAGRPPVTNMYESIIWVSFGVMLFASILYAIHRQAVLYAVACALTTLGLIASDAAPAMIDPGLHPLVPVLRSNYWLTIHVLTITLGYAAFALTLGIGNVTLFQFLKPGAGSVASSQKVAGLNQLTYRAMQFGVVLLAAGTILGGIWADYSWGRFWGWDPKEVWALIALLGYLVILHARFTGWMRQFGFAAWTVVAFVLVVMAWYGVNFVLGVGLHSYGFASGGYGWVLSAVGSQMAYVALATFVHMRRRGSQANPPITPQPVA